MTAIVTEAGLNENIEILLGLPGKIRAGVQTSVNHEVICSHGDGQEFITDDSDIIIIRDENGRDVTDYYWWARPGKYTVTVASFMVCPAIGPEKAPTEITSTSSPQFPVSNLKVMIFDFLKAQLETNGPSSLTRKDITFDFRSSPFNAGLINLRLTENNTVSSFSAAPKLEAGSSPSSIKSVYLGVNAAPQGLSRLGTPNAILGLTSTLQLGASAAPSSLKAWDDATDDPRAVEVFNLSFLDQPDASPTEVELINLKLKVGPESIIATKQLEVGPESLSITVSPVVGPTELSGSYKLFAQHAPTSVGVEEVSPSTTSKPGSLKATAPPTADSGPTGLETSNPPPLANEAPTGISYLVDADGDGFYPPVDLDDNDFNVRDGTQDADNDGLNWLYDIDPANSYSAGVKIPGFGVWMPEGAMNQGGALSTMTPSKGFFTGSYNRENSTLSSISKVAPGSAEMQVLEAANPSLNFEEGVVYERVLDQNYNPVKWLDKQATTSTTLNYDEDYKNCRYLIKGFITNPSGAKGYDEWNSFGVTNKVVWFFTDSLTVAPQGGGSGASWIKSPYAVAHGNSDGLAGRFPKDLEFKKPETMGEVVIGDAVPNKLCKYQAGVPTEQYQINSTSWLSRTHMVAHMQEFEPEGAPLSFKHILEKCLVYSTQMSSKIGPGIMYNADPYRVVPWHVSSGNGGTIRYYCDSDVVFTDGTSYSKDTNFTYWSSTMTKPIASWTPNAASGKYIGTLILDTRY